MVAVTSSAVLSRSDGALDRTDAGAAVRKLRVARGWTLKELAERSGISLSTLSRIETGQCGVAFHRANALSKALDVDAVTLLTAMSKPAPQKTDVSHFQGWRSVTQAGAGKHIDQMDANYEYLCNDFLHRRIVGSLAEITARSLAAHGPMISQPGERFVFVLDGPVIFATPGFADVVLNTGDSMQFDASIMHALLCGGDKDARVLLVASSG